MTLWSFDTSTRELVYNDPEAGALRFSLEACKAFDSGFNEINIRRSLPRANNSDIVIANALRLR